MKKKIRDRSSSSPKSRTGQARHKLYAHSLERISTALKDGYALEAICLLESLITDRLEARKAAIHGQKTEQRKYSTLKTLAQELNGKNSTEPDEAKKVYGQVLEWVDGRNSAIHEFAKLREGSSKKWETKYKEARKTAVAGGKLFRGLDKIVKKLNKLTCCLALAAFFAPNLQAAPANDNFYAATVIKGNSGSVQFNCDGYTIELGEPAESFGVWFSWTPPVSGPFTFVSSGYRMHFYTGKSVNALTYVTGDIVNNVSSPKINYYFTKGTTYFISTFGYPNVNMSWQPLTGPANDNYSAAQTINGVAGSISGTMTNAGLESGEPGDGKNSIWYQWSAPLSGKVVFDTLNSPDVYFGIYTGSTLKKLNQVGYAGRSVEVNVTRGLVYYIRINAYSYDAAPTLSLNWNLLSPPSNDSFEKPTVIAGSSGTINGSTSAASVEDFETNISNNNQSVWFSWTAPFTGVVDFNTSGSLTDTTLIVSNSAELDTLNVIGDASGLVNSGAKASIPVISGNTYRIAVATANEGSIQLNWIKNTTFVPSVISLVNSNYNATEAGSSLNITLSRNAGTDSNAVSCYLYTEDGSATSTDYSGTYTQVNFANGVTTASVSIPIYQDRRFEGEETFTLRLSSPSEGCAFGRSIATVNITDDEPFIPLKANYTGLIQVVPYDNNLSGTLKINATGNGSFSGSLMLGGTTALPFIGSFNASGKSIIAVARKTGGSVLLNLTYADNGNRIRTLVTVEGKTAEIQTWRIIFGGAVEISTKPFAFTAKIKGLYDAPEDAPKADGFLSVTVSATGLVKIVGSLADDSTITSSGQIAGYDFYPLYASLYKGKGSLSSNLVINETVTDTSSVTWFKMPNSTDKSFKTGFTQQTTIQTSPYVFSKRTPIIADVLNTQGLVDFLATGPGLPANGATQSFRLMEDNSIALPLSPQIKLSLKFVPATGFFTGTYQLSTEKATIFKGAVFQTLNSASGFFLATDSNGLLSNGTIDMGASYQ